MAITSAARAALFELAITDSLLYSALTLTVHSTRDETDVDTLRVLAGTLKTYDRADIEWCLGFMTEHPELRDYWAATIHRLNADDFHLYLDRLDDLWERMTSIPGVTAATAWPVLNGYRGKDPGTKRSHGTAVFMINAALLTSMKAADFEPSESGLTTHVRYSAFAGESFDELTPAMIDFAIERAADVDRIVEIILTEHLWQPEALRYRLDGKLTATTAAEELAYPMIIAAVDAAPDRASGLNHMVMKGTLTETEVAAVTTGHTNSIIGRLAEKVQGNDLDALRSHASIIRDYGVESVAFYTNTLDTIIKDLRNFGQTDLTVINNEMLPRVGKMISTLNMNFRDKNTPLPENSKHREEYCSALRTVAAIGSKAVQQYIGADPKRTITLAVRHEATTHDALISVIEEAASHGALAEGFI